MWESGEMIGVLASRVSRGCLAGLLVLGALATTAGCGEAAAGGDAGAPGLAARAKDFLIRHMPEKDRGVVSDAFLDENLALALDARTRFPWAGQVPEEIFLNDVLPYAVLDEARDPWRGRLLEIAAPVVARCTSAAEAAQALNREFFKRIKVHYDTGRKKPNQSPAESMALGKASCTGLSILLVDACRAVGIPARVAGTAAWAAKPGNHTWVEIWDGSWHFTGADEFSPDGLDHAWFTGDARQAGSDPAHAIFASSWKATGMAFPLAWNPGDQSVPGLVVTDRYTRAGSVECGAAAGTVVTCHTRLFSKIGGDRIAAAVEIRDAAGNNLATGTTRAGTADMNDMARLTFTAGPGGVRPRARHAGETREWPERAFAPGDHVLDLDWSTGVIVGGGVPAVEDWLAKPAAGRGPAPGGALSRAEAARVLEILWEHKKRSVAAEMEQEMKNREVIWRNLRMKWLERTFGDAPAGHRRLWISLHGGGGAPAEVNDSQWQNQIRLYAPEEGIVVAPRAPTNTWNLWHEAHIDPLLDRLIAGMVATRGVHPDKIHLLGYSAGGDGVYQLAPRTADRWAAAAMMAGHPNEAQALSLRNLPFSIHVGANDDAYHRNQVAADWGKRLDALQAADPGGYIHRTTVVPGCGHWMNGKDAEALPWMAGFTRQPWPPVLVWLQDDITHDRFHWIGLPPGDAKKDQLIRARVDGQKITIEAPGTGALILRLSDELLDLDREITVSSGGKTRFQGKVARRAADIATSLDERPDPRTAASAILRLD